MDFKYYNHAFVSALAPHEEPNIAPVVDGTIWKTGAYRRRGVVCRWTTDFDCGKDTGFYYIIKDDDYDIGKLKAKRRYEITKARKNFNVKAITVKEHGNQMFDVLLKAFEDYPSKYRPKAEKQVFIDFWNKVGGTYLGAFIREQDGTEKLCGYVHVMVFDTWIDLRGLKSIPKFERLGVNAALVDGTLKYFSSAIANGSYICDGSKTINHETNFQDYLEKYFGFRKAFCHLHIVYNPKIKWLMRFCYTFRKPLQLLDEIGFIHNLNGLLKMEEIARKK